MSQNHCDVGISLRNDRNGISVTAPFSRIGGDENGSVVVSNNGRSGVCISRGGDHAILRNTFAGVSPDGNTALGNVHNGIEIDDADFVTLDDLIVASANGAHGIEIQQADNVVIGRIFAGTGGSTHAVTAFPRASLILLCHEDALDPPSSR